ncbi:MAG: hypothetical protein KDD47_28735 [Acidobacteria bacterium]|nr:hypothetical protein [Acidobacteriota bacterium]
MTYTVAAQSGDCLCTIARREGFSNCGTLRSQGANAGLLHRPLAIGDLVSIPQAWNGYYFPGIAMGRRHTFRWIWPVDPPQPVQVRIVRKAAAAPAAVVAAANLGISRFVPRSASAGGADDWVTHDHFDYSAPSNADPNTFSIEVVDPNATGNQVWVYLEALQPTYGMGGALTGHQRFTAGAQRRARTLWVAPRQLGPLAATDRFWSPELRLVVDNVDRALRPRQTLLVTDLFADDGSGTDIQILDQNIRAVYEYADCPNDRGEKCILAWNEVPLRRGRSVSIEARILRATPDGTANDNGLVHQQDVRRRIARNCRRFWAQEEITFTLDTLETIDPPCDMLTISEPTGADASGHVAGGDAPGQIAFTLTNHRFAADPVLHAVGPYNVPDGNTPAQTAGALRLLINELPNLTATVHQNAPENGQAQGSVDLVIACDNGHATITHLTGEDAQDSAQKAAVVVFNRNAVEDEQSASQVRKGGPAMRRQLFKSVATGPQRISVFVVREARGGLTTSSLAQLAGAGQGVDAAVRNCLSMQYQAMSDDLAHMAVTLPHEIGHALTDADHVPAERDIQTLMHPGQLFGGDWYDNKRISGPGLPDHDYDIISNAGAPVLGDMPPAHHIRITRVQTTMHALIAQNDSLTFTPR